MNKTIRSVSISNEIDEKLIYDSKNRGLTISANVTRILYDYFIKENGHTSLGKLPVPKK